MMRLAECNAKLHDLWADLYSDLAEHQLQGLIASKSALTQHPDRRLDDLDHHIRIWFF